MSFEPVTYWTFRCDGDTARGQCPELYSHWSDEDDDDELEVVVAADTNLDLWRRGMEADGWITTGNRILCAKHATGLDYLTRAMFEGLPFAEGAA